MNVSYVTDFLNQFGRLEALQQDIITEQYRISPSIVMFQLQTHNSKMISVTGQKQPLPHSAHVPLHHKDKGVWDARVSSFA